MPVKVAGKTGTAQYGTQGKAHAWFTAFAPYDNPEIVLTILIEGGGEGGINAVPVAKDVLSWYFKDR
jgi:penicillin-binding protein 2